MSAKRKKDSAAPAARARRWLSGASVVLAFLWPAALVVGGYVAWHQWGAQRLSAAYGQLALEQLEVTPPPDFIRTKIVAQVFEATDLASISLLDRQAAAQIAHAFATNPWVESVDRVQKLPGGQVRVTLRYRRPGAMVYVEESRHPEVEGPAYFAVDREAVLLPPDDFAPADTQRYVHISIPGAYPASGVGTPFGDARVTAAAALAAVLSPVREETGITRITVLPPPTPADATPVLALERAGGASIVWGSPPGQELDGEVPAPIKLQRLLAAAPNGRELDLRVATRPER